jgi:hypothetical protein
MKVCDCYKAHYKGDRFPAKKLRLPPPGALCAIAYGGRSLCAYAHPVLKLS